MKQKGSRYEYNRETQKYRIRTSMGLKKVMFTFTGPACMRYDDRVGVKTNDCWIAVLFGTVVAPMSLYACPSTRTDAYHPRIYLDDTQLDRLQKQVCAENTRWQ